MQLKICLMFLHSVCLEYDYKCDYCISLKKVVLYTQIDPSTTQYEAVHLPLLQLFHKKTLFQIAFIFKRV